MSDELVSAEEARRLREMWDQIGDVVGPSPRLALTVEVQAWRIAELERALVAQRRQHRYVEDCWYSCPKADGGCCNELEGKDCNCGADEANALIDSLVEAPR